MIAIRVTSLTLLPMAIILKIQKKVPVFGRTPFFSDRRHLSPETNKTRHTNVVPFIYQVFVDLSYAVFAQLVRRLKNTTRKVTDLAFIDVSGRIARCLIDLSAQPEAMILPNGRQIRITRQEIGRIVGCSREMVGRVLKTLEEQGMIETDGKAILIFDASLEQNEATDGDFDDE